MCLAVGCRSVQPGEAQPLDTDYLAKPPQKERVAFQIVFARFDQFDEQLMSEGWALVTPPAEETVRLWQANGLKVGWAAGKEAAELRRVLKNMSSLRAQERRFEMPSQQYIKVVIARRDLMGLVYETLKAKAYADVADLEFALLLRSVGTGKNAAVSVVPFFAAGEDATSLEGMQLLVELARAEVILIGPIADPEDRRLGTLMQRDDPTGRSTGLLVIEPELVW